MTFDFASAFYDDLGLGELHSLISIDQHTSHGHRRNVLEQDERYLLQVSPTKTFAQKCHSDSSSGSPASDTSNTSDTFAGNLRVPEVVWRDKLVNLYFQHVQPLCPVVNEVSFRDLYLSCRHDDLLCSFSAALLHAMMFAAIQVRACGLMRINAADRVMTAQVHRRYRINRSYDIFHDSTCSVRLLQPCKGEIVTLKSFVNSNENNSREHIASRHLRKETVIVKLIAQERVCFSRIGARKTALLKSTAIGSIVQSIISKPLFFTL